MSANETADVVIKIDVQRRARPNLARWTARRSTSSAPERIRVPPRRKCVRCAAPAPRRRPPISTCQYSRRRRSARHGAGCNLEDHSAIVSSDTTPRSAPGVVGRPIRCFVIVLTCQAHSGRFNSGDPYGMRRGGAVHRRTLLGGALGTVGLVLSGCSCR